MVTYTTITSSISTISITYTTISITYTTISNNYSTISSTSIPIWGISSLYTYCTISNTGFLKTTTITRLYTKHHDTKWNNRTSSIQVNQDYICTHGINTIQDSKKHNRWSSGQRTTSVQAAKRLYT